MHCSSLPPRREGAKGGIYQRIGNVGIIAQEAFEAFARVGLAVASGRGRRGSGAGGWGWRKGKRKRKNKEKEKKKKVRLARHEREMGEIKPDFH